MWARHNQMMIQAYISGNKHCNTHCASLMCYCSADKINSVPKYKRSKFDSFYSHHDSNVLQLEPAKFYFSVWQLFTLATDSGDTSKNTKYLLSILWRVMCKKNFFAFKKNQKLLFGILCLCCITKKHQENTGTKFHWVSCFNNCK